jgi:hypothetical protein
VGGAHISCQPSRSVYQTCHRQISTNIIHTLIITIAKPIAIPISIAFTIAITVAIPITIAFTVPFTVTIAFTVPFTVSLCWRIEHAKLRILEGGACL